jgi:O-antigen/teichoic acid export membrane protein
MSRLLKNSISGYLGSLTTMAIGLVLTPFMVRQLGHDGFGVWVLVTSLALYLALLDFGMGDAVMRYVAVARADRDESGVCGVVSTAFRIYLIAGLLSVLVAAGMAYVALPALDVPPDLLGAAQTLLVGLGVGAFFWLPGKVWDGALRGAQRFDLANGIQILNSLILAGGTVLVLRNDGGLRGLAVLNVLAGVAVAAAQVAVGSWAVAGARVRRGRFERRLAGVLARYSGWIAVVNVSYQVYARFDAVLLAIFFPIAAITPYNVAYRAASLLGEALKPVLKLLLPMAATLHTRRQDRELRLLFLLSTRIALAASLAGGITLSFLGERLIRLWIGASLEEGTPVLLVFLAFFAISNMVSPAREVLKGQSRLKLLGYTAVGDTVANVALSAALARPLGLVGVALGSLVPSAIVSLAVLLPSVMRQLGLSAREFFDEVVAVSVLPSGVLALLLLAVTRVVPADSWPACGLIALLSVATFVFVYMLSPGSSLERGLVRDRLRRLPARPASVKEVP